MRDIVAKPPSLREARAQALVRVSLPETIAAIQAQRVPKGDVFAFAKVAALFAVKKTSDVIPDCHPLPIENAWVDYRIQGLEIYIIVGVRTVYKTGVEVEAMHGASVAAVTLYDMLKPIDPSIEIGSIKLLEKHGGKSDWMLVDASRLNVQVVVCSDRASAGVYNDTAGKAVVERLRAFGVPDVAYSVIPDDLDRIQALASQGTYDLTIFVGGTGVSPRDVTPDAIRPILDVELPGVMEAARAYGQQRTPFAMLSRGIAGFVANTLVVTVPGSEKGAVESVEAIFPALFHVFNIRRKNELVDDK